ncbi:MAG: aminotransferase class III-fold pyridoxal phosphate-dependent enzyme, partial [Nitrospirae bacterium]|nr:aminotransferase class III-fold pyridoxal phosphate-dependent enzyme [Nitrospirota bacterium]
QMAMAAGAATIEFVKTHRLDQHAQIMGERLLLHLRNAQASLRSFGDVRGRGLMIGVEIVDREGCPDTGGAYPAAPELARKIQSQALSRGLILELGGRNGSVVRFLSPLVVTAEEVDTIASIFCDAARAAEHDSRL